MAKIFNRSVRPEFEIDISVPQLQEVVISGPDKNPPPPISAPDIAVVVVKREPTFH